MEEEACEREAREPEPKPYSSGEDEGDSEDDDMLSEDFLEQVRIEMMYGRSAIPRHHPTALPLEEVDHMRRNCPGSYYFWLYRRKTSYAPYVMRRLLCTSSQANNRQLREAHAHTEEQDRKCISTAAHARCISMQPRGDGRNHRPRTMYTIIDSWREERDRTCARWRSSVHPDPTLTATDRQNTSGEAEMRAW